MTKQIGSFNSSITRVRPFFKALLTKDSSGKKWLPALLNLASNNRAFAATLAANSGILLEDIVRTRLYRDRILAHYGVQEIKLENCFERSTAPSDSFLKWLIDHPVSMKWPMNGQKKRIFGAETQSFRERLLADDAEVKAAALSELLRCGAEKSKLKWWAFEGFTEVDCCLETDKMVLFIEGKRTEKLSPATDWYKERNQVVRNLEVARNIAGNRQYAVLVISEMDLEPITDEIFIKSLPHLSKQEVDDIQGHFLGCTTWEKACNALGIAYTDLPDKTADALS